MDVDIRRTEMMRQSEGAVRGKMQPPAVDRRGLVHATAAAFLRDSVRPKHRIALFPATRLAAVQTKTRQG